MPKVSVILTSFNHESYIREAIESVLAQTFEDFQLIIWDDASSDDSWNVINSYLDPRIKVFRNDETRRGIYGINIAITEIVLGEYIAIHHSDDVWEPGKLEKQVAFLDNHLEIGAVFTNALAIAEDGSPLPDEKHFYSNIFDQPNRTRQEWLRHFFYHGNALCHPSVLIRKRCFLDCGTYRFGLAQLADFDMWIRLCLKYEICVLQEKLVRFRVHANEANMSGNRRETRIRSVTEFYQLLSNYLRLDSFDEFVTVFPEAESFYRKDGFVPEFVLAMLSLEPNALHMAKAFGSISLFNLLWDDETSEKIKELYNFDYRNLIELTGKYDIFSLEVAATLKGIIAERDREIANYKSRVSRLDQALAEREARIVAMENSTFWKLTFPLRRALADKPTLRRFVRRTAQLVWWTVTFQLSHKLRLWRAGYIERIPTPHFAPPTDDYCVIVPFTYSPDKWKSAPRVVVICHMFYSEMADEFQRYLANIPFPFDLLITTNTQEKRSAIEKHFHSWRRGEIEIRIAPNRGRDIAPKLIACQDAYDKYEFVLHIHTKKSPHTPVLTGWRFYLLETLLGSETIIESIFESFRNDPKLGMIAPQHYAPIRHLIGWGLNFENAKIFARRLGVKISLGGELDFPSGSMFWARSAALKPLLDCNLSLDEFPSEDDQNDGTLGHVIERLYFFCCERAGYRWIKISPSALPQGAERVKHVKDQKELQSFIKNSQHRLLKPRILKYVSSLLGKLGADASKLGDDATKRPSN